MVRLVEAEKELGVSSSALGISKKYKPFLVKTNSRKVTYFDIEAYLKHDLHLKQSYCEATLLIEYIGYFNQHISKASLARLCGSKPSAISDHNISGEVAIKLLQKVEEVHTKVFNEFKEYYR